MGISHPPGNCKLVKQSTPAKNESFVTDTSYPARHPRPCRNQRPRHRKRRPLATSSDNVRSGQSLRCCGRGRRRPDLVPSLATPHASYPPRSPVRWIRRRRNRTESPSNQSERPPATPRRLARHGLARRSDEYNYPGSGQRDPTDRNRRRCDSPKRMPGLAALRAHAGLQHCAVVAPTIRRARTIGKISRATLCGRRLARRRCRARLVADG